MLDSELIKQAMLDNLKRRKELGHLGLMRSGKSSWSVDDMLEEVNNDTEVGIDFQKMVVALTIDLLARDKIKDLRNG